MMRLDFPPTREHRKPSGTIGTVRRTNRSFPSFLGKSREEIVHFPCCASHVIDKLDSRSRRTSLDLFATTFYTAGVLVDEATFASCRKAT